MSITRDANYPAEMAALFQAFNRCADGYKADVVLDVAMNLVIAAIGYLATERKSDLSHREDFARANADRIVEQVMALATRAADPSDVPVSIVSN